MNKISAKAKSNRALPGIEKNYRDTLRLFSVFNAITGVGIIEYPYNHPRYAISFIVLLLKIAFYCSIFWYSTTMDLKSNIKLDTEAFIFNAILYINIAISTVCTILHLWYIKTREICITRIVLVDETLLSFGIKIDYNLEKWKNARNVVYCTGMGIIIFATDMVIGQLRYNDFLTVLVNVLLFQLPLLMNSTIILNFITLIQAVGHRFTKLNDLVKNARSSVVQAEDLIKFVKTGEHFINSQPRMVPVKPNITIRNKSNVDLLMRTTRQLHLELSRIARSINMIFNKQLVLEMTVTFLLVTGFLYCLYLVLVSQDKTLVQKSKHATTLAVWCTVYVTRILHLSWACRNVSLEGQKMNKIIHELGIPFENTKLCAEVQQFSLQLIQRPLLFNASGFVDVDFVLIRGFVGAVTTYLVILIQMN